MYQPELGKYYLFTSYDPLMTTYNVRVAYSDSPEGPFVDFYGEDIKDTTNNVPILTAPYRFENHPGWAGTAHCGLIDAGDGRYFMVHQGRLCPPEPVDGFACARSVLYGEWMACGFSRTLCRYCSTFFH